MTHHESVSEEWWVKITPHERYLISLQVISQRGKKRLSCRIQMSVGLRGGKKGDKNEQSKKESCVTHRFLLQQQKGRTSTSSNKCLLWRHVSKWQRAPFTAHHQRPLKRTVNSPILSFRHSSSNSHFWRHQADLSDLLRGENGRVSEHKMKAFNDEHKRYQPLVLSGFQCSLCDCTLRRETSMTKVSGCEHSVRWLSGKIN